MFPRVTNRHSVSSKPIPENGLLETDSDISSECDELNLTQDYLGLSWRSGITSGNSSRRVVINETPQPLGPAHRVLYSSGHHSPPRSILRTPSVKTSRRVHHSEAATQQGKAKQVDILRIESKLSNIRPDYPTRKPVQNPFPKYYQSTMETVPQQTKPSSYLQQLLRELQNLLESLTSAENDLSQINIDHTPISSLHESLSTSLQELEQVLGQKSDDQDMEYSTIGETLKLIISYLIMTIQGLSDQCWKVQEEVHDLKKQKKLLQKGKESLLKEQQELHHVFEISKAQMTSEKNELRLQQDSITAAKLELLKQCNVLDHSKGSTVRNRRTVHVIDKDTIYNPTREEQVANSLQLKNLRKANVVAKQELAVARGTVLQLQQQMEKQQRESQRKMSDLTRRLQESEDTIKLAAGALRNEKEKQLEKCGTQQIKLQNSECGNGHRKHKQCQSRRDTEQLWETASKFVQQTKQLNKNKLYRWSESISYPSRLSDNHTTVKIRSKRKTTRYY